MSRRKIIFICAVIVTICFFLRLLVEIYGGFSKDSIVSIFLLFLCLVASWLVYLVDKPRSKTNVNNEKHFDEWSQSYDSDVIDSDNENTYPFAGYENIISSIFDKVNSSTNRNILDIGVGTGNLASRLYEEGHRITGVDFSIEMIEKAKIRMPDARFIKEDFTRISDILNDEKFDFIIFTYSIHHLNYEDQYTLLKDLQNQLNVNGTIIIGDVLFSDLKSFQANKTKYFKIWDEEEHYPIVEDYINNLQNHYNVSEKLFTHCSGIISLDNEI